MKVPNIIFKKLSLEETIDNVIWTYFDSEFHEITINTFPELGKIDTNLPKEKIEEEITRIFTNYYNYNSDAIDKEIEKYNNLWKKYNDVYFEKLSEYLNINWPTGISDIEAYVGLACVFPRFLEKNSFIIGSNLNDEKVLEICAHETLHFLWFEKWKSLYKDYNVDEFESPHNIWRYSEMVVDPILNSKTINSIFGFRFYAYNEFYDMYDEDKKVMDKLNEIFNREDSIENKIKSGFEYINEYLNKEHYENSRI